MWVLYKSKQGQNSVRHNQTLTPELCDPITYIQNKLEAVGRVSDS